MATNPPITIGPFANVPAPGSGVKSDWAQQITNYVLRTAWTAVTFNGNWANYGNGYQGVQYRKEGDRVWLRGQAVAGATPPNLILTLPVGFRPVASALMMVDDTSAGHSSRIDISTGGTITMAAPVAATIYGFDRITFSISAT